jgi:hypothetical protein
MSNDAPFMIDQYAYIPDGEVMQSIINEAAAGNPDAQKVQSGLINWTVNHNSIGSLCLTCSQSIDIDAIGGYFIGYCRDGDQGIAGAFCDDCAPDDPETAVKAGIVGLRKEFRMQALGPAGQA